jgi:hypothetical protein
MINPTDYSFDIGIYTGLSLAEVYDLGYEKLTALGQFSTGDTVETYQVVDFAISKRWDDFNELKTEHYKASYEPYFKSWEQKIDIRRRIIQMVLDLVEEIDGPKEAEPIIEEITPVEIDSIESTPIDDGLSEIQTTNSELEVNPNDGNDVIETSTPPEDVIEQPNEQPVDDVKQKTESNFQPIELTQSHKPSLKPTKILFPTGNMSKKDKKQFTIGLGQVPLVYYNGIHIEYNRIKSFTLYHEGILPACKISFTDQASFRDVGFPTDDISITVYIHSRSKLIRSIYMDFKVTNMRDFEGTVNITGIANIPQIYIRKFESFGSKTSMETMQEVAKLCKLGFSTNINSTNDKQTWINPGYKRKDFIENICKNAYISDSSFVICYVDFYYNLCYMDLEKEIERDITEDRMRLSTGKSELTEEPSTEEEVIPVLLTTDKSALDTNCHVTKVDILNRSTSVSLNKAYLTKTKFYDDVNKEMLIFDIDTIAEDREKLTLKAKLNDSTFYEDNKNNVWVGKIDKYEEGKGNAHDNYNYALIHNKVNKSELSKIDIDIEIAVPNYNFYLYQKIRFELIYDVPGALSSSIKHERISGEAIINSLEFIFDGKKHYQKIGLLRRDLEKTEEEIKNTGVGKNYQEKFQDNENQLGPNDNLNQTEPDNVVDNNTTTNDEEKPTMGDEDVVDEDGSGGTLTLTSKFQLNKTGHDAGHYDKTQIVIHYSAGHQRFDKGERTINSLNKKRNGKGLSYHYIIDAAGHIEQLIPDNARGFHGTISNRNSIGISLLNLGYKRSSVEDPTTGQPKRHTHSSTKPDNPGKWVDILGYDGKPDPYRSSEQAQEMTDEQITALKSLVKKLSAKHNIPYQWNGKSTYDILFPPSQKITYKKDVPGIYTHGSISTGKKDVIPTLKVLAFFKDLKLGGIA